MTPLEARLTKENEALRQENIRLFGDFLGIGNGVKRRDV